MAVSHSFCVMELLSVICRNYIMVTNKMLLFGRRKWLHFDRLSYDISFNVCIILVD